MKEFVRKYSKFVLTGLYGLRTHLFLASLVAVSYFLYPSFLDSVVSKIEITVFDHFVFPVGLFSVISFILPFAVLFIGIYFILNKKDVSSIVMVWLSLIVGLFVFEYFITESPRWNYDKFYVFSDGYIRQHIFCYSLLPIWIMLVIVKLKNGFPYAHNHFDEAKGFVNDTSSNVDEDLLDSEKYVKEITDRIFNTNVSNEAFVVGIEGAWGHGKSSFFNLMENKFQTAEWIKIRLNSWYSENSEQILNEFFKEFRKGIRRYNRRLSRLLLLYSQDLLKIHRSNKIVGSLYLLTDIFGSSQTFQQYYDEINLQLSKLDKSIIIFIDDLDRLDPNQIWEILRLVKVTASFKNVVFVLAYDKSYLADAIKKINPSESYRFVEKIVSYEHHLVPIRNATLADNLLERLNLLIVDDASSFNTERYESIETLLQTNASVIDPFIKNFRDVKRFVNSFSMSLNCTFLEELNIQEFFIIELVRYKYFKLYQTLNIRQTELFNDQFDMTVLRLNNE